MKTNTKYKKLSNKSQYKQDDMIAKFKELDEKHYLDGVFNLRYSLKQSDTTNHYMVMTNHERNDLIYTMQQTLTWLIEYEADIRTFMQNDVGIIVPLFGEPTAKLRRDPMAGYKTRNQQSPFDVIGGLLDKLSRVVYDDENISREMITRFNQLLKYLFRFDNGTTIWKIDAKKR